MGRRSVTIKKLHENIVEVGHSLRAGEFNLNSHKGTILKVFVVNQHGKPLMPTTPRQARLLLSRGRAKIVGRKPFTIQLLHGSTGYTQGITLGIDAGYQRIGFSAVTAKEELIGGEVEMLNGQRARNEERAMYRRQRRNRLRYRKPHFDNRRKSKGGLAPSIQHKLDTHIRLIESLCNVMPVMYIIIETAAFDIQGIKNPDIEGVGYQSGEQAGFWNLREYILHRDHHRCQNPDCKGRSDVLQVHHLGYWKADSSDRPDNLIALCTKCHTSANHKPGKLLYGWQPKVKSYRPETFMSTVRWRLIKHFDAINAYGYQTKSARIALGLEKSHHNDAFVIACGTTQKRKASTAIKQRRRNNRNLEKFYDAKYIDIRTGEKASGQALGSGRRTRNKELSGENLRAYRGEKVSTGKRAIRRQRYALQPGDIVLHDGAKRVVNGTHCKGSRVLLYVDGKQKKSVGTKSVTLVKMQNGLVF